MENKRMKMVLVTGEFKKQPSEKTKVNAKGILVEQISNDFMKSLKPKTPWVISWNGDIARLTEDKNVDNFCEFGYQDYNKDITGGKYCFRFVRKDDLPLWVKLDMHSKGIKKISTEIEEKIAVSEHKGVYLNYKDAAEKVQWQIVMNKPKEIAVVSWWYNDKTKNMVEFALRHGVNVSYYDLNLIKQYHFTSVGNMYENPIYQWFYVREDIAEVIIAKRQKYWNSMNNMIRIKTAQLQYDIAKFNDDRKEENIIKAVKASDEEYFKLVNKEYMELECAISKVNPSYRVEFENGLHSVKPVYNNIYKLNTEQIERICYIVDTFGPAFNISVQTHTTETTSGTYLRKLSAKDKAEYKPYAGATYRDNTDNIFIDPRDRSYHYGYNNLYDPNDMVNKQRKGRKSNKLNIKELVEAYNYIAAFLAMGNWKDFMDDNYTVCPVCGMPRRLNSNPWAMEELAICAHCGDGSEEAEVGNPYFEVDKEDDEVAASYLSIDEDCNDDYDNDIYDIDIYDNDEYDNNINERI